jgi:hypothetical protein
VSFTVQRSVINVPVSGTSVVITLDTTPPAITWGAYSGAAAGSTFTVAYTTDEAVATAYVKLADDRVLPMTVGPASLSVALPSDTPQGLITVYAADDVGNAAPHTFSVTGVVTPSVVITLDTTPPAVVFGNVSGVAGETYTVPYTTVEPVAFTYVILGDGRRIDGIRTSTQLIFELPEDTPDGLLTIYAADDVGNPATATRPVSGVVTAPVTVIPRVGGLPGAPEIKRSHGGGRSRSRYGVGVAASSRVRVRAQSAYGTTAVHISATSARATSADSLEARIPGARSTVALHSTSQVVRKRPEGPKTEEEMILWLL